MPSPDQPPAHAPNRDARDSSAFEGTDAVRQRPVKHTGLTPGNSAYADLCRGLARDGYAVVENAVSPVLLNQLRAEIRAQIEAGPDREPRADFLCKQHPDGNSRFFRLEWITDRNKWIVNDSLLQIVGQSKLLSLMAAMVGDDFVITGTTVVFKGSRGGPAIDLHRDHHADRQRFHPKHFCGSADIYTDYSGLDNGCLEVIPGSHLVDDVRPIIRRGFANRDLVDLHLAPGDILVHDNYLVHGSKATPDGAAQRSVIYISFQSARWALEEGVTPGLIPPRHWIAECMKLVEYATTRKGSHDTTYRVPESWSDLVRATRLNLRPYPRWASERKLQETIDAVQVR